MNLEQKAELSKIIIERAISQYPRIFAACSFGKDSRVIIDLALQVKPDFHFIGIDTGYEFAETLQFADELARDLQMNFRWVRPSEEARARIDADYGDSFIKNDQYKCCEMKIPAIESIMDTYDAWMTGLRRDETQFRQNIKIFELGKIIKVNPIAFWTKDEVWQYIKEHNLRYHPLYDKGYFSLGCEPCTTQGKIQSGGGRQGQFERAGRFRGTSNNVGGECGLHTM